MRHVTTGACVVAALLLAVSPSLAQPKPADCPPPPAASPGTQPGSHPRAAAPEKIEGTVTDIDGKTNMVTLRSESGQQMQFRGNPETIKDLKVGDRLELNKRAGC